MQFRGPREIDWNTQTTWFECEAALLPPQEDLPENQLMELYQAHLPVRLLVQLSVRGLEHCSAVFSVALSEEPQYIGACRAGPGLRIG